MIAAWMPHGVLDWALLVYVGSGAWAGYRRGLLLCLAALASDAGALAIAAIYGPAVLAAADRAWGLSAWLTKSLPPVLAGAAPQLLDRSVGWAAFAAVFLVARAGLGAVAGGLFGRRRPSHVNAGLGLAFGALERLLIAAAVLALADAVGRLPAFQAADKLIAASAWARSLVAGIDLLPASLGRWAALF